jgi:WD40 repeat protein
VQLYDQNTMHLLQTYHRDNLVTDMSFETFDPNLLAATANDGSLTLYDIRLQQSTLPALEWTNMLRPEEEALTLSMGFGGNIAALGSSKGKIHFFDIRASSKVMLGSYVQSHTDEVTRVRFQNIGGAGIARSTTPLLVSGSEDGLACVFDSSQATEESAVMNILPVQAAIREVGFFGPSYEGIYCLTGSESMKLYHKDESVCRHDFGLQFREYLSHQLHQAGSSQGMTTLVSQMEYLVDCHWDPVQQELLLLAGSAKGDAALFQVGGNDVAPLHFLHGGHRGVIRAWYASPVNSNSFLTVGEDARMCEWNRLSSMMNGNGSAIMRSTTTTPQIIMPSRKRSGAPVHRGAGGGKLRRPRSRMTSSPY